jgi:predicted O-methyltransferase YrrM
MSASDPFNDSLHKQVDRYLLDLVPARDDVLQRMEQHAVANGFPYIGPLVGPLLGLLARSIRAERVFEMGSGFGFSAVHFARALPPTGKVICTDGDPANAELAAKFFREAGLEQKIEFRVGNGIDIIRDDPHRYDIILMDIDKQDYPAGFKAAWPKLSVGGLFIADNLLWHGKVMSDDQQPTTAGIRELSRLLYATSHAVTTILPLRDGVSVTLKTA